MNLFPKKIGESTLKSFLYFWYGIVVLIYHLVLVSNFFLFCFCKVRKYNLISILSCGVLFLSIFNCFVVIFSPFSLKLKFLIYSMGEVMYILLFMQSSYAGKEIS